VFCLGQWLVELSASCESGYFDEGRLLGNSAEIEMAGKSAKAGVADERLGMLFGQLAQLLKTGMPLPDALRSVAADTDAPRFKAALTEAAEQIAAGVPADQAFAAQDKVLGSLLVSVAASSSGGSQFPLLLSELSLWETTHTRIWRRLREAFLYPYTVLVLTVLLMLIVDYCFRMQGMWRILDDATTEMDQAFVRQDGAATTIMTTVVLPIISHALLILLAAVPLLMFAARSQSAIGRIVDACWVRWPVVSTIARPLALGRICGSAAILLRAGVPLHVAFRAAGLTSRSHAYAAACMDAATKIEAGKRTAETCEAGGLFPATFRHILTTSKEHGDLPTAFDELGRLYALEAEGRSRILGTVLPPMCLLFVGVYVGLYVWTLYRPLVQTMQMIGG